jgi:RHS repeat-associated protein
VRPHAVSSTTGSQSLALTYDANGNLSTQGAAIYAFDAENRLKTRDDASSGYSYTYDGNGALAKRTVLGSAQTATVRPNAQGFYSQWTANPNVPHYQNVAEAVPDGNYIEQAAPSLNDTHLYPTANVPANAVVDKVTLKYLWEAWGIIGAIDPMYRQGGVDKALPGGVGHWGSEGWVTDSWALTANPVTGGAWTAAQVNGGLEFGFRTVFQDFTPRVTQAWIEVTYRVPTTTSTLYIGGVYEKNSDGSIVKYYRVGGSTAMRKVPSTGGAGTLYWVLSDHLGSASTITDALGAVVSTQKYWPYGATRATTGTLPTDKQYTGQRIEPGDALGLYNYKARFYSTTVGRFVSADTVTPTADSRGLNRYSYAADNPLRYVDPSGHCFTWGSEKLQECSQQTMLNWMDCGIAGHCKGGVTRAFANTVLHLREFFGHVMEELYVDTLYGGHFEGDVKSIRSTCLCTSRFNQFPDGTVAKVAAGVAEIDEGSILGAKPGARLASAVLVGFDMSDYSYLDVRVSVFGQLTEVAGPVGLEFAVSDSGRRARTAVDRGRDNGPVDGLPVTTRSYTWGVDIEGSLFDPDLLSLRVDVTLVPMGGASSDATVRNNVVSVGNVLDFAP